MTRNVLKATSVFTLAIASLLFLGGCNKTTICLNSDGDPNQPSNPSGGSEPDNANALVTFNASIEGRNMLRSMSLMPKGIQCQVFAFRATAGENATSNPEAYGLYVTSAPGVLSGHNGYKMYLSNGVYDFYAVSDNYSRIPPVFTNGISQPLENGIDYLWWSGTQQDVNSSQVNVPIIYMHVATQVVLEVTGGDNITLNELVAATITPSTPGASMSLGTGAIAPASSYSKADKMGINGFTAQYIMLPIKNTQPMTLTLDIQVDNEITPRTYTAQISLPDDELKAGNSYLFKTVINKNTITFPSVYINAWTEVDETGNPIYPTQKN